MRYMWFKRKHTKPGRSPGIVTSTSSSTVSTTKHPKPAPKPPKPYRKHSPCRKGIKYWCFSEATAKRCKYVSISKYLKVINTN